MALKITLERLCIFASLFLLFTSSAFAQDPLQIALVHIAENKENYRLNDTDISDYVVTDQYQSKKSGVTHIYLRQRYQGIGVEGAILNRKFICNCTNSGTGRGGSCTRSPTTINGNLTN
jgi:extracellular elastinolytic metalloproteinase